MPTRIIASFLVLFAFAIITTGCTWVGQTSGKVQAKMERKTQAVKDGYDKGYEEEKNKQK